MPSKNSAVLKTSAILATAGAVSIAALLLTQRKPAAATDGPPPPITAAQSKALNLNASLASTHLLAGSHTAYMAVTLEAPKQDHLARPDVDLAVVFDRSGSMEGEKLSQAKLAARQLITGLENGDRFSITAYGTDVDVLFPSTVATDQAKQAALMTISQIYTDGGTNMSGGILAGRSQLLGLGASNQRVQRIVLISDGQANEGIVGKSELADLASQSAQQGVSITTVGVGLDFDEQTMTRIAVSGRGNYYFAESADMLAQLFSTELSRLGATVATRVQLRIAPQPGAEVLEVLGYETIRSGGQLLVNVADMHAGETRKVIVALQVQTPNKASMSLAKLEASFFEPGATQMVTLSRSLGAEITSNQALVDNGRDMQSNRLIERALTAKAIERATALYEQGDSAEAARVMTTRTEASQAIAGALDDAVFAAEMAETEQRVKSNFAQAPAAASAGGKKARKSNRKDAYQLMY